MTKPPQSTTTSSRGFSQNDSSIIAEPPRESQVLEIAKCRGCGSDRVHTIACPPHSAHYGAIRCANCDSFRGWAPKPSTTQKRLERQREIASLLTSPVLSDWQRGFLRSIENKKKLSPQQLQTLRTLKLLVGGKES